ncbi:outer membrane beta-barrel protein [Bacteroidales bacterium OttesenSCG-928-C19]|nr:outer membrane beta-barrel protein [Bacteroidales bacterium OttesenSCG-928-C19]
MNKRIIYTFLLFLFLSSSVSFAQKKQKNRHEVNFSLGTGVSSLIRDSELGTSSFKWSNNLGINYTFFFSSKLGIGTGAEIALYKTQISGNNFETQYLISTPPELKGNFYLNTLFDNYTESLTTTFINIPLLITFQAPVLYENLFYVTAGVKACVPFLTKYETTYKSVKTMGYSDYTQQIYEEIPNHGFDTYKDIKTSGELDLNLSFIATAETGMKWILSDKWNLYTGLWFDYGLNDIRNNNKKIETIVYNENNPSKYSYNSLFSSQQNGEYLIEKASLTSFGFRIRLAFGNN